MKNERNLAAISLKRDWNILKTNRSGAAWPQSLSLNFLSLKMSTKKTIPTYRKNFSARTLFELFLSLKKVHINLPFQWNKNLTLTDLGCWWVVLGKTTAFYRATSQIVIKVHCPFLFQWRGVKQKPHSNKYTLMVGGIWQNHFNAS